MLNELSLLSLLKRFVVSNFLLLNLLNKGTQLLKSKGRANILKTLAKSSAKTGGKKLRKALEDISLLELMHEAHNSDNSPQYPVHSSYAPKALNLG